MLGDDSLRRTPFLSDFGTAFSFDQDTGLQNRSSCCSQENTVQKHNMVIERFKTTNRRIAPPNLTNVLPSKNASSISKSMAPPGVTRLIRLKLKLQHSIFGLVLNVHVLYNVQTLAGK